LSYRHGGENEDFQNTIFDDEADLPIGEVEAPFSGRFRPDDPLTAFDDQDTRGTWQLCIQNVSETPNGGSLNSWGLEILVSTSTGGGGGGGGGNENDPPTPHDDTLGGIQNTPRLIQPHELLGNDLDPNNDPLTIVGVANSVSGQAELNGDGTILFTPELGGLAPGHFQYVVSDGISTGFAGVTIILQPLFPFHNGYDVDNDGFASPNDALLVINFLNAFGPTPITGAGFGTTAVRQYLDVVPDNFISNADALEVINFVNANGTRAVSLASGEAEGEPADDSNEALTAAAVDLFFGGAGRETVTGDYLQSGRKRRLA
jgi:hypothetical protein